MKTRIKSVLNNFIGIEVYDVKLEKRRWTIDIQAACANGLSWIIRKVYEQNGMVGIHSPDSTDFMYWISIPEKAIEGLIDELKDNAAEYPELTEQLELVDCYNLLDSKGKKKYAQFVKYIRRQDIIGYLDLSAAELLHHYRDTYHNYSKADEVRAILEFNSPERALEALIADPATEPED